MVISAGTMSFICPTITMNHLLLLLHVTEPNASSLLDSNCTMVRILDGNLDHTAHACRKTSNFYKKKKKKIGASLAPNKCLNQIKLTISPHSCTPELLSKYHGLDTHPPKVEKFVDRLWNKQIKKVNLISSLPYKNCFLFKEILYMKRNTYFWGGGHMSKALEQRHRFLSKGENSFF